MMRAEGEIGHYTHSCPELLYFILSPCHKHSSPITMPTMPQTQHHPATNTPSPITLPHTHHHPATNTPSPITLPHTHHHPATNTTSPCHTHTPSPLSARLRSHRKCKILTQSMKIVMVATLTHSFPKASRRRGPQVLTQTIQTMCMSTRM